MVVGLLWYDNSAASLRDKLLRAARRYEERFGNPPNVCYVHPAALPEGEQCINQMAIRASERILRHHLWVARETPPATSG